MRPIYNTSKQDNNCYLQVDVRIERTAVQAEAETNKNSICSKEAALNSRRKNYGSTAQYVSNEL